MGPGVGYMPVLLAITMILSIMTTYLIAVLRGHVTALFPYISDTGVVFPERQIFSLFINLAAFLAAINIFLRYKLVQAFLSSPLPVHPRLVRLSKACLGIGLISCFGLNLVANFQEDTLEPVHYFGAMLVFGLGVVYAFMDSAVSFMMCPAFNGVAICWYRVLCGCCSLACLVTTMVAAAVSRMQWSNGKVPEGDDRMHWKPTDPGYTAHLVSTFGEWGLAFAFLCYFFTFISDFNKMEVFMEARPYVSHLDLVPTASSEQPSQPNERTKLIV